MLSRTHLRDGHAVVCKSLPLRQLCILSIQRRQLLSLLQASGRRKYSAKLAASARGDRPYLLKHDKQIVFLSLEVLSFLLSLQSDLRGLFLQRGEPFLRGKLQNTDDVGARQPTVRCNEAKPPCLPMSFNISSKNMDGPFIFTLFGNNSPLYQNISAVLVYISVRVVTICAVPCV